VLGDARLTLAKQQNGTFDLIIVDAFSSGSVPIHLMTVEALKLYLDKLGPRGICILHISNRYLDLEAVVGANAKLVPDAYGLLLEDDEADGSYASTSSTVAVFSRSAEALDSFRALSGAREINDRGLRAWTDDYSDVISPFLYMMRPSH
jgi:spermidine synthase